MSHRILFILYDSTGSSISSQLEIYWVRHYEADFNQIMKFTLLNAVNSFEDFEAFSEMSLCFIARVYFWYVWRLTESFKIWDYQYPLKVKGCPGQPVHKLLNAEILVFWVRNFDPSIRNLYGFPIQTYRISPLFCGL